MARIYKFSFPLPGRKSSPEKQPVPDPRYGNRHNADDSPMFNPGEKARRLLGTSEPNSPELKQKQSWRARRQAKKSPSFISVTKPNLEDDLAKDYEDTVIPQKVVPNERIGAPAHTLRNKPSSPLLGHHFIDDAVTWGSVTDVANTNAHHSESSATLQSYYDPMKSPLAISQQTSASSARDMALRKGCKPIARPLGQGLPGTMTYPAFSDEEHLYNNIDSSKRKPPQLDLSTLFPKPRSSYVAAPLPSTIVKSPSQISLASTSQRWESSNRPSWTAQDGTKEQDSTVGDEMDLKDILRMDEHHIKMNVKRPTEPVKNWFDGLGEDDDEPINVFPGANSVRALPEDPRAAVKVGLDEVSKDLRLRQRKSSMSNPHRRPLTSRPTLSFRLDPAAHAVTAWPRHSLQSSGLTSTASSVSRRSRRSAQVTRISISGMDLLNQSVLVLSSSDDEIEQSSPRRRARIRDSIEVADIGNEPLVYSAETMRARKPRPVIRVLSGKASKSNIPPVPKMPETPQLHQRAASKKFENKSKVTSIKVVDDTDIKRKLASMEIMDDPNVSAGARTSTKVNRSATHKIDYARCSKMMAVTEEEEKLLEAMRKKRASIRKLDFAEGFHEALQLHGNTEAPTRPRTASVDGRCKFIDPDRTTPIPPFGQGLRNSLTGAPFAASTDDLVHVDSYTSPETTQRWSRNASSMPPSDPSPSLSFSPSDILPSPPSSCLSPKTPPPGLGFLEVHAGGVGAAPSRQLRLWETTGHDRKQSVSSGVLTLSSEERKARDVGSEESITGWRMDRW